MSVDPVAVLVQVPGPVTDTLAVMSRVTEAFEAYLDRVVWPN